MCVVCVVFALVLIVGTVLMVICLRLHKSKSRPVRSPDESSNPPAVIDVSRPRFEQPPPYDMGPFNCHGLLTNSAPNVGETTATVVSQHSHTSTSAACLDEVIADAEVAGYVTYLSNDVDMEDEGHFVPDNAEVDAKFDDSMPPQPTVSRRCHFQDGCRSFQANFADDHVQDGPKISSSSKSMSVTAVCAFHSRHLPPNQCHHDVAISNHQMQETPSRLTRSPAVDRQLMLDSRQLAFRPMRGIENRIGAQVSSIGMDSSAYSSSTGTSSLLSTSTCPLLQLVPGNAPIGPHDNFRNRDHSNEIDYY